MDGVAQVATGTGFLPCWRAAAPARTMLSRRVPRGLSRKLFIASNASLMAPMTGSIGDWLLCSTDEGACWSGWHNQGPLARGRR